MSAQVCTECTAAYSIGAAQCPQCGANNPRPLGDEQPAPHVTVRCPGQGCTAFGVVRRVLLRLAAPGVVERPLLHCATCDLVLETVRDEEKGDDDMPKVTVHGGPSIEGIDEGGEESSPTPEQGGGTSSASSEKDKTSPETSENETPQPAPKTGSRSAKARTAGSTARRTDGGQTAPSSDGSED